MTGRKRRPDFSFRRRRPGRGEHYCLQLFDTAGQRKYLAGPEREAFLLAASRAPREVWTFCGVPFTGCRLSEALALTADRVDLTARVLVFESLKKQKQGVFRAVPVPPALLDALDLVHGICEAQRQRDGGKGVRLWA